MSGEIAVRTGNDLSTNWSKNLQVADQMIKTGFLPKQIRTAQQAVLVMETGRELGLPPMESLRNIFIVDNKTALASQLMLSLLYRSNKIEDIKIKEGEKSCTVSMQRKGMSPYSVTFSEEDARKANLLYKDNWKKYPKNMFRARAISMCARVVAPDVISGLYTPDEIEAQLDTEEISTVAEKSKTLIDDNEYTAWIDGVMDKLRYELPQMTEPEQVNRYRNSIKGDLKAMIEADRAIAEGELRNRENELITGEPARSKIQEYKENAELCPNVADLENWFRTIQSQAMNDLTDEELKELVDFCTKLRTKIKAETTPPKPAIPPTTPNTLPFDGTGDDLTVPPNTSRKQPPEVIVCGNTKCSTVINDPRVVEYSKKHFYGKVFCRNCQKLVKQK